MSRPSWEREAEFRALLQRCAAKASREGLETLADIAVRDDKVAYKAVCGLLMHEMKHVKPGARLRLFYALSAILRASKARRGERDKYAARLEPLLEQVADLLAGLADPSKLSSVLKVLDIWFKEEVFDAFTVAAMQTRFRGLLASASTGAAGSSGPSGTGQASATGAAAVVAPGQQQQQQPQQPQQQQLQQQLSSPGLLLSSMSPASFSAGGSRGRLPGTAGGPGPSNLSQPAAGAAAPGLLPSQVSTAGLRTVGSSSQLLRQQSTEAYDPLASAAEEPLTSAAAGARQPWAGSALPPPPAAGPPAVSLPPGLTPALLQQLLQQQQQPPAAPPPPPDTVGVGECPGRPAGAAAAPPPPPSGAFPPLPPSEPGAPPPPPPPLEPGAAAPPPPPPPEADAAVQVAVGTKRKSRWS